MITRERLKELWENHAMVYLADHIMCDVIYLPIRGLYLKKDIIDDVEYLFETKEECKWYAEFGNIKRIDTLSFPRWEEIGECYDLGFHNAKGKGFSLIVENYGTYPNIVVSCSNDYDGTFNSFEKEATKENYIKACEICKKLFLGEKL